jgi:hypothetical protein
MPAEDVLSLYKSLMDLTIQVYPKSLSNVDKIFQVAAPVLAAKKTESPEILKNSRVVKVRLLLDVRSSNDSQCFQRVFWLFCVLPWKTITTF